VTDPTIDREVRQDVADVLVRYATGIDRRDWTLFRSCFTDDCEADYGDIGVWRGGDEITAWMERSHASCGHTVHRITNVVAVPEGDSDRVAARSYVDAVVMGPHNETGSRSVGYYDDELVRTGDGWRIARRRYTMVHLQLDIGPSASLPQIADPGMSTIDPSDGADPAEG
jgi:3-phenylpropionate/cinnamic acid dioxygenase small subunit